MSTYELQAIQRYHEAGHAVVAHALGGRVVSVSRTAMIHSLDSPAFDGTKRAVVCVAGGVAARLFGPRYHSMNRSPSESDLSNAAAALGVERVGSYSRSKLEAVAREILLDMAGAVRAVASALYHVPEITGEQVERLFEGESVESVLATPALPPAPTEGPAAARPEVPTVTCWAVRGEDGTWTAEGSDTDGEPLFETGRGPGEAIHRFRAAANERAGCAVALEVEYEW